MNFRRTLLVTLFAASTSLVAQTATAGCDDDKHTLAVVTKNFVEQAITQSQNDLKASLKQDLISATHSVSADKTKATYVAKVDVETMKHKG